MLRYPSLALRPGFPAQTDEAKSRALLEQADVIFCEWCLGNLKWYSHNKQPHQRLVARFHLQERELPYVAESNWDNIDHISYVSEFIRREGQKAFGFPFEKTSVIPNLLDESKFTPKKKTGDARYTLGIIGVAPARKRLDRALDLLEEDDHYCLRVNAGLRLAAQARGRAGLLSQRLRAHQQQS
ncbi:hypothetical protein [Thiorhodospira sibirica]|uniref:hypothetical protein n=1 Tax=Thiorhodospira sibirica TaxID=154347 RepID=UPI00022C2E04|nr:hypothetical protein [Thiorhodospira sibirica]